MEWASAQTISHWPLLRHWEIALIFDDCLLSPLIESGASVPSTIGDGFQEAQQWVGCTWLRSSESPSGSSRQQCCPLTATQTAWEASLVLVEQVESTWWRMWDGLGHWTGNTNGYETTLGLFWDTFGWLRREGFNCCLHACDALGKSRCDNRLKRLSGFGGQVGPSRAASSEATGLWDRFKPIATVLGIDVVVNMSTQLTGPLSWWMRWRLLLYQAPSCLNVDFGPQEGNGVTKFWEVRWVMWECNPGQTLKSGRSIWEDVLGEFAFFQDRVI